ncbi:MAG: formylglycine-generating enzyme family protein [Planctomycetaceae bacterium]|nr:MAG: formylglycine-generating enzyme family protein [Planctomycetaceae bacterium]
MGNNPSHFKGDLNRPVESISWNDAKEFADQFSQRYGVGARLPTEAEWEYACRAGTRTQYSFGNNQSQLSEYAWFSGNSNRSTQRVRRKKPNPWGLYDMHGNVWEWVADWYGGYEAGAVTDPTGPRTGSSRVLRGGSWNLSPRYLRSASRSRVSPGFRGSNLGVRLALDSN